jgi:Cu/Ag efflux pump CusA
MRENVQRRIVVQSNVSGRDLRSVVNDIQARVGQNVRLPQGYRVEYGGQFESEAHVPTAALALACLRSTTARSRWWLSPGG